MKSIWLVVFPVIFFVIEPGITSENAPQDINFHQFHGKHISIKEPNVTMQICSPGPIHFHIPRTAGFVMFSIEPNSSKCERYHVVTTQNEVQLMKDSEILDSCNCVGTKEIFITTDYSSTFKISKVCGSDRHDCQVICLRHGCREHHDLRPGGSKQSDEDSFYYTDLAWFLRERLPLLFIIPSVAILVVMLFYERIYKTSTDTHATFVI